MEEVLEIASSLKRSSWLVSCLAFSDAAAAAQMPEFLEGRGGDEEGEDAAEVPLLVVVLVALEEVPPGEACAAAARLNSTSLPTKKRDAESSALSPGRT